MELKKMKLFDFDKVDFYPKLIKDYLNGELRSKGLVDWDYSLDQLEKNKSRSYSKDTRAIVHRVLLKQYSSFDLTEAERTNVSLFKKESTFSITTGHQLVLLGGPMFFYTKILDVIKLAKKVSTSKNAVVPIFWMASEDHDYEEISKVNLFGKVVSCPGENKGPVGRMPKQYFESFLNEVNEVLGDGEMFQSIKSIINLAFNSGENLSEIMRIFVRELFKDEGLLIIDGDDKELKELFIPVIQDELQNLKSKKASEVQISKLSKDYKIQVNPRDINLFYIEDEVRVRIVKTETGFSTVNNIAEWSNEEVFDFLNRSPEKISPNVILRPVYQEVLLPNLAYVGGAGEIAYWLELKDVFNEFGVPFPLPIVRVSYFVMPSRSESWLVENNLEIAELFGDLDILVNEFTKKVSGNNTSFLEEIEVLKRFYSKLFVKGQKINSQLEKVVLGEEKRALSAMLNVEKRFLNAEKLNQEQSISKLKSIREKLFPHNIAMERVNSFIPLIVNGNFKSNVMSAPLPCSKKIVFINS